MRWVAILAVLGIAALFALLSLGNHLLVLEARDLWTHGRAVEGTITAHDVRKRSSCEYSYAYPVEGQVITAARRSIPCSAGSTALPIGAKLPVRYNPNDPEKSTTAAEMETLENWGNRLFLPVITLVMLGWAAHLYGTRHAPPPTDLS